MAHDKVKVRAAFAGYFRLQSVDRVRWLEIAEGTPGVLSNWSKGQFNTVTFELSNNDKASAPIDYTGLILKTDVVQPDRFERV